MAATLKTTPDELVIETDFGYTYKVLKVNGTLQLEESFDEAKALNTPPAKIDEPEIEDEDSDTLFNWN